MKRHIRNLIAPVAVSAFLFAGFAPAAQADDHSSHGSGVNIGIGLGLDLDLGLGSVHRSARLTGAAEVPGPGDPDGRGHASVRVKRDHVCATLVVKRIQAASAAHIHRGAAGTAGPVVVHLAAPADGSSSSCSQVGRTLAQEIARHPERFYVNVHNPDHPAGAVRGQLHR
ncbi:CHRD domain-containing protein [Lentzea albidocapillata]|uniref:CHRD domain-containing protein n=1 Tax=Lentzea albidocapillata TaxID=40571 RepID=A0A1W2DH25_9PSEU|nr:CHRD domain-containing protein [Lentzea albidocapillata]SMC96820.1 CHRD domain-containing protein [Lentzea albidocapillata]